MKAGSWYLVVFVATFLYFYIYAVNYVRGAVVPLHPDEEAELGAGLAGYLEQSVQELYRQGRQGSLGPGVQQPVFPRLSMQYHNYTR